MLVGVAPQAPSCKFFACRHHAGMSQLPTPRQCAAARALLGWSQADLAEAAGVGVRTVSTYETGEHRAPRRLDAIRTALEQAGVRWVGDRGAALEDPMCLRPGEVGLDEVLISIEAHQAWQRRAAEKLGPRLRADGWPLDCIAIERVRVEGDGALTVVAPLPDGSEVTMTVPPGAWAWRE